MKDIEEIIGAVVVASKIKNVHVPRDPKASYTPVKLFQPAIDAIAFIKGNREELKALSSNLDSPFKPGADYTLAILDPGEVELPVSFAIPWQKKSVPDAVIQLAYRSLERTMSTMEGILDKKAYCRTIGYAEILREMPKINLGELESRHSAFAEYASRLPAAAAAHNPLMIGYKPTPGTWCVEQIFPEMRKFLLTSA